MRRERPSRGIRRPLASDHLHGSTEPGRKAHVDVLLDEVERAEVLGENPSASPLWTHAPWGLRRRYADSQIDDAEFWRALRQWIQFDEQAAA